MAEALDDRGVAMGVMRILVDDPHAEDIPALDHACLACRFEFEDRKRLAKPGRCPACKSTRIALPRFAIESR